MVKQEFTHIGISCTDQAATEDFYCKHFAFKRKMVLELGSENIIFIKTEKGDLELELFKATEESKTGKPNGAGPLTPGFRHIAFKVENVDEKLKELGSDVEITQGPIDFGHLVPGMKAVWVLGPDGVIIEISQ